MDNGLSEEARGVYTPVTEIRRRVFKEVARLAYTMDLDKPCPGLDDLPFKVIPGDHAEFRGSVFLERAIVAERVRLAMGLPLRPSDRPVHLSDGVELAMRPETYYEPPLVNVIKFACHACQEHSFVVSDQCQGCLAHPCTVVCPTNAITVKDGKAHIDQETCIKCGRCKKVCPYTAIIQRERPCAAACGMHCIHSDAEGKADIDYERCVSCGQCLVHCPFGAIADKSQLFQVILSIRTGQEIIAAVAPAFVGQYGGRGDVSKLREAFRIMGFAGLEEVAIGADLCSVDEAHDYLNKVPHEIDFMATSCCPAWAMMARGEFPEHKGNISMALTPMTLTARMIRKRHPKAKIVFIGPCSAKKLEAQDPAVRSEVDFVLTFEEVQGMLDAHDISYTELPKGEDNDFDHASSDGRGYAVAGGVAHAVANVIKQEQPGKEIPIAGAQTLDECRQMMKDATSGKYPEHLLEGMACPGGCIAGPGTLQSLKKSAGMIKAYQKRSPIEHAYEDTYVPELKELLGD